jgi:hypothetical protein
VGSDTGKMGILAMWQCGSAADASRGIGHWALGIAGLRRNTRSDCRRAATHSAPSNIAALSNYRITELPDL